MINGYRQLFFIKDVRVALIVLSLMATQIMPTFGNVFGHTGNLIPIAIGMLFSIPVFFLIPVNSKIALSKSILFVFVSLFLLAPSCLLLGNLLQARYINEQVLSDALRPVLLGYFIALGFLWGRFSREPPSRLSRMISYVVVFAFCVNVLYLGLFIMDPNSQLLEINRTRVVGGEQLGGARFVGNWNYPYNLAIFINAMIIYFVVSYSITRRIIRKVFYVSAIMAAMLMIALGQSRSAIVLLFSSLAIMVLWFSFLMLKSRTNTGRTFATQALRLLIFVFGVSLVTVSQYTHLADIYLRRLLGFFNEGMEVANIEGRTRRFDPIITAFENSPEALVFGLASGAPGWLNTTMESGADYIARYGILGFGFYFIVPMAVAVRSLLYFLKRNGNELIPELYILLGIIFGVCLTAPATQAYYHFRLFPLLGVLLGLLLFLEQKSRIQEGPAR